MPSPRRVARLTILAGVPAAMAGAWVLRRLDPNAADSLLPACPVYSLTGFYCPGCGSTRCLHALVHFDLVAALAMNPLLVVALPLVACLLAWNAGLQPAALAPAMRRLGDARLWLWGLLGFAVLRNLPFAPFAWLAPG